MNRGLWHLTRRNRIHNRLARRYLEQSRKLDPFSAAPYPHLAVSHLLDWTYGWSSDASASLEAALATAREGVALDPRHSESQAALSACLKDMRRHNEAIEAARHAVTLNPYTYHSHHTLGSILSFAGSPAESLEVFQSALQLNPKGFDLDIILSSMALNHLLLRDFTQAIQCAWQSIHTNAKLDRSYYRLAAALAYSDDTEGASAALIESQKLVPGPSRGYLEILHPFKNPDDFDYLLEGLRLAGWRDTA
jgi:adenylate cyclase